MKYLLLTIFSLLFIALTPNLARGQTAVDCKSPSSFTKILSVQDSVFLDELNSDIPIEIIFRWNDPRCYKERINLGLSVLPAFKIVPELTKNGLTSLPNYSFSTKASPCKLVGDCDTLKRLGGMTLQFYAQLESGNNIGDPVVKKILLEDKKLYCAYKDDVNRTICIQGSDSSQAVKSCKNGDKCPQCDIQYANACGIGQNGKCFVTDVRQCGEGQGETKLFCSYTKDGETFCPGRSMGKNDNVIGQQCGGDGKACPACSTTYQDCDKNGGCKISLEIKCSDFKGGSYVCNNNKACVLKDSTDPNSYPANATTYNNIDSCNQACKNNSSSAGGSDSSKPGPQDTSEYELVIENPVNSSTLGELISQLWARIFVLIIPLAVIVIVYAGILMMSASYDIAQYERGKKYLKYAIIALIIIFIGRGFITLLKSILALALN